MITDADVKKLTKVFATKDDLDQLNRTVKHLDEKIEKSYTKLSTSIDHAETRIEVEVRKVERKVDNLKERLDILEDNVTGEIAKLQNENNVSALWRQNSRSFPKACAPGIGNRNRWAGGPSRHCSSIQTPPLHRLRCGHKIVRSFGERLPGPFPK